MLVINHRGHLTPNHNIPSTLEELKTVFVDTMPSQKRVELFDGYQRYCADLKSVLEGNTFTQWVDGSYVTTKADPNDIDVVTFVDAAVIDVFKEKLAPFKSPDSILIYGVDGYFVETYPETHKRYKIYLTDKAHWMDDFDKTTRTRTGRKHPKGFLEINY